MNRPFNTISVSKNIDDLTEDDLIKITKRLRDKVDAQKNAPPNTPIIARADDDLKRAEAMLDNLRRTGSVGAKADWDKPAAKIINRKLSAGKVVKKAAEEGAEEVVEEGAEEVIEDGVEAGMKAFKFGRTAAIFGMTAVGVAGIADIAMNAGERHRAKVQQRAQHQKQADKDKKSKKYNYAGTEYQPDAFGDVVLEMFNQRTGHYKMGNAKFTAPKSTI